MKKDVIVKKSKIKGRGVFALRDFKKGEVVLKWNPKPITKAASEELSDLMKRYVGHTGKSYYIMQSPEKYVNHSCESSTFTKSLCDVTRRDIKKGEEITSNYGKGETNEFKCECGSKKCRKLIS